MLIGKRILITGGSQGIGLAVGRACHKAGADVVLSGLPATFHAPGLHYISADLSIEGQAKTLVEKATKQLSGLDVLINNVGTYREPAFDKLTRKDFDTIIGLNVWSAIEATQAFVQGNKNQSRGGRILFTSSLNATRSEPAHTLYDASKGALNALVRQLAIELAPWGFTTAAIAPGLVETPLTDFGLQSDPQGRQAVIDQIPLKRIATVEDVAEWFVFLASDAAGYATGVVIPVDGGLDAQQMPTRPITDRERNA